MNKTILFAGLSLTLSLSVLPGMAAPAATATGTLNVQQPASAPLSVAAPSVLTPYTGQFTGDGSRLSASRFGAYSNFVVIIAGDSWSDTNFVTTNWTRILQTNQLSSLRLVGWVNKAIAGRTTKDATNEWATAIRPALSQITATNVGLAFYAYGINDSRNYSSGIGYAASAGEALLNTSNWCYRTKAQAPAVKIIVATAAPSDSPEPYARSAWRAQYNGQLPLLVTLGLADAIVDVQQVFRDPGNSMVYLSSDKLHPTDTGYKLLAQLFANAASDVLSGRLRSTVGPSDPTATPNVFPNGLAASNTVTVANPDGNPVGLVVGCTNGAGGGSPVTVYGTNIYVPNVARVFRPSFAIGGPGLDQITYGITFTDPLHGWTNYTPFTFAESGKATINGDLTVGGTISGAPVGNAFIVPPASATFSASAAWPYAALICNRFEVKQQTKVRYVNFSIGTQGSGKYAICLYGLTGAGLLNATNVVNSGVVNIPVAGAVRYDLGATTLVPGNYMVGIWASNTVFAVNSGSVNGVAAGKLTVEIPAASAPPSSFTISSWSNRYLSALTLEGDY